MDMSKIRNIFYPFFGSFFDRKLYAEAAFSWQGILLPLILTLIIITQIPSLFISLKILDVAHTEATNIASQLPTLTFKDGKIIWDKNKKPIPLFNTDKQQVGIFDPNDTINFEKERKDDLLFALNSEKISFTFDHSSVNSQLYNIHEDMEVTKADLYQLFDTIHQWARYVYPVLILIINLIIFFIEAVFYSAVGYLILKQLNFRITYPALFRVTIIAMIPAILIKFFFVLIGVDVPFIGYIGLVLTILYVYFGLRHCAKYKKNLPQDL